MYNYGIGGNEVKTDASEAISDISNNKTILVQKLTTNDPVKPEAIQNLKTIEDVFEYYKPQKTIDFEMQDGSVKPEEFQFSNLGDFGVKNIVAQSTFLKELNSDAEQCQKISQQFKSNKILQSIASDSVMSNALINALSELLKEINAQD